MPPPPGNIPIMNPRMVPRAIGMTERRASFRFGRNPSGCDMPLNLAKVSSNSGSRAATPIAASRRSPMAFGTPAERAKPSGMILAAS